MTCTTGRGMRIDDEVLHRVRTEGFAVVEGFLTSDEVAAARAGVFDEFPTHEQYFADPAAHTSVVAHQFAGLRVGPFPSWPLTRLAFIPTSSTRPNASAAPPTSTSTRSSSGPSTAAPSTTTRPTTATSATTACSCHRADQRWPQLTTFIL